MSRFSFTNKNSRCYAEVRIHDSFLITDYQIIKQVKKCSSSYETVDGIEVIQLNKWRVAQSREQEQTMESMHGKNQKFKNNSDAFSLQYQFVAGYGIIWYIKIKEDRQTLVRMYMKKMMTSCMDLGGDEVWIFLFWKACQIGILFFIRGSILRFVNFVSDSLINRRMYLAINTKRAQTLRQRRPFIQFIDSVMQVIKKMKMYNSLQTPIQIKYYFRILKGLQYYYHNQLYQKAY
ncbi:unnamed protein product [Paramecium octaurelia]|uniref:Transmembrane protein n=1 Tax=Paramecium octaurelia TaxID=43137 RepID=A0A8S1TZ20_PAROT|nr:unnamed protein product [Paramecium octaurelia]